MICNCLVVLRPFVRTVLPFLLSSSRNYVGTHSDGTDPKYGSRRKQLNGCHPLTSLDHIRDPIEGRIQKYPDDGEVIVTNTYQVDTRIVDASDSESTKQIIAADGFSREYRRS